MTELESDRGRRVPAAVLVVAAPVPRTRLAARRRDRVAAPPLLCQPAEKRGRIVVSGRQRPPIGHCANAVKLRFRHDQAPGGKLMPPRRTRRGLSCQSVIIRGIWAVLVPLAVLLQLVKHAPGIGVLLLLAASAAGGIYLVRRARKAEQHRLENARQAQIREVQSREIARYHVLGPKEFEHAIAYLCERDGCTNVEVSGGAGDLGADVVATAPDGRRIVIQCKRYGPSNKVGSPEMQRFGGTCYSIHGAHIAALVTTSTFTRQAASYGAAQRIRLYDAQALAGWASQTGPAPWQQVNQLAV